MCLRSAVEGWNLYDLLESWRHCCHSFEKQQTLFVLQGP